MKGQIIGGGFGEIFIRQKSGERIEMGELLVAESDDEKSILQVYDLTYGSQISQQNIELISGLQLEENLENEDVEFMQPAVRNYFLSKAKNVMSIKKSRMCGSKSLPKIFSAVREIRKGDIIVHSENNPLTFGFLRSGSVKLDIPIVLDGKKVLQHHILVPATTGRGKSNFIKSLLWSSIGEGYAGILVLDPHDEYYGRTEKGLRNHQRGEEIIYYSKNPVSGGRTLRINIESVAPAHFKGAARWSDAQEEALYAYYKRYGRGWIQAVLTDKDITGFSEGTLSVIKRRLSSILDILVTDGLLDCRGIFDINSGSTTVKQIVDELEQAKIVVIDTSSFSGQAELLIGSIIANNILSRRRYYKRKGMLDSKPVISIVLEEAPRVIGKAVLESGSNIFETIAREGRKFLVGLIAITQLPSLIPREILANMNTKVILGLEMKPERQSVIESAAQDLSDNERVIAALNRGEAIITSHFTPFAVPIAIPNFVDLVKDYDKHKSSYQKEFLGVELV